MQRRNLEGLVSGLMQQQCANSRLSSGILSAGQPTEPIRQWNKTSQYSYCGCHWVVAVRKTHANRPSLSVMRLGDHDFRLCRIFRLTWVQFLVFVSTGCILSLLAKRHTGIKVCLHCLWNPNSRFHGLWLWRVAPLWLNWNDMRSLIRSEIVYVNQSGHLKNIFWKEEWIYTSLNMDDEMLSFNNKGFYWYISNNSSMKWQWHSLLLC